MRHDDGTTGTVHGGLQKCIAIRAHAAPNANRSNMMCLSVQTVVRMQNEEPRDHGVSIGVIASLATADCRAVA